MRVIIAGSRTICDPQTTFMAIQDALNLGWKITEVVSGMAGGPDRHGKRWAEEHGIPCTEMPADWLKWGQKKAGPIRNVDMAVYAKLGEDPGGLIAVWDGESSGTAHMVKTAKKFKMKIHLVTLQPK